MSGGELVVIKRSGGDGMRYPLPRGLVTLGRDDECHIRVLLPKVSAHHATIAVHRNQSVVRNVSDSGLTLVNGVSVSVAALKHNDVITLGDRSLRWEYFQPDAVRSTTPQPAVKPKGRKAKKAASRQRLSEVVPRRIDAEVKAMLELNHRASMPGTARQVAVVQPQRRGENATEQIDVKVTKLKTPAPNKRASRGVKSNTTGGNDRSLNKSMNTANARKSVRGSNVAAEVSSTSKKGITNETSEVIDDAAIIEKSNKTPSPKKRASGRNLNTSQDSIKAELVKPISPQSRSPKKSPIAAESSPKKVSPRRNHTPGTSETSVLEKSRKRFSRQSKVNSPLPKGTLTKALQWIQSRKSSGKNADDSDVQSPRVVRVVHVATPRPKAPYVETTPTKLLDTRASPRRVGAAKAPARTLLIRAVTTPKPNVGSSRKRLPTPRPVSAKQGARKAVVHKIEEPLTMDDHKKAALLILTGRSPKGANATRSPTFLITKPTPIKKNSPSQKRSANSPKSKRGTPSRSPNAQNAATPHLVATESTNKGHKRSTSSSPPISPKVRKSNTGDKLSTSSRRSTRQQETSPLLSAETSPRKSALKSPLSKSKYRKSESIKFDLSNLDLSHHSVTSAEILNISRKDRLSEGNSLKLHYSASPEITPSARRSLQSSRSSRILEKSLNGVSLFSPDRSADVSAVTGTPSSPSARKASRSSLMVQKALETSTPTVPNPMTKALVSEQMNSLHASRTQSINDTSRSLSNMESYSVVDLVSMESSLQDVSSDSSVYDSAGSINTSVTASSFATPIATNRSRTSKSSIQKAKTKVLGTSTPLMTRTPRLSTRKALLIAATLTSAAKRSKSTPAKSSANDSASAQLTKTPTSTRRSKSLTLITDSARMSSPRGKKSAVFINESDLSLNSTGVTTPLGMSTSNVSTSRSSINKSRSPGAVNASASKRSSPKTPATTRTSRSSDISLTNISSDASLLTPNNVTLTRKSKSLSDGPEINNTKSRASRSEVFIDENHLTLNSTGATSPLRTSRYTIDSPSPVGRRSTSKVSIAPQSAEKTLRNSVISNQSISQTAQSTKKSLRGSASNSPIAVNSDRKSKRGSSAFNLSISKIQVAAGTVSEVPTAVSKTPVTSHSAKKSPRVSTVSNSPVTRKLAKKSPRLSIVSNKSVSETPTPGASKKSTRVSTASKSPVTPKLGKKSLRVSTVSNESISEITTPESTQKSLRGSIVSETPLTLKSPKERLRSSEVSNMSVTRTPARKSAKSLRNVSFATGSTSKRSLKSDKRSGDSVSMLANNSPGLNIPKRGRKTISLTPQLPKKNTRGSVSKTPKARRSFTKSPKSLVVTKRSKSMEAMSNKTLSPLKSKKTPSKQSISLGEPLSNTNTTAYDSECESPRTPENADVAEDAVTPVLNIQNLLNASYNTTMSSVKKAINRFENLSSSQKNRSKDSRKTVGGIGQRIRSRTSAEEGQKDKRAWSDPMRKGRVSKVGKKSIVNVGAVKKVATRTSQRTSNEGSIASDKTDENAPQPNNDIVVTPKSSMKLIPQAVKHKHSTAKKPIVSRKSVIDNLDVSQEIVKQLFSSPVKRKLSQSMTQYSISQLSDNDEPYGSGDSRLRRSVLSRQTLNNTYSFDDVGTPQVPTEVFVSPMGTPLNQSPNLAGIKKLFGQNTPNNDLRNVKGIKKLLTTPGNRKSPRNDLTNVLGVKSIFETNSRKGKSPKNDLTNVAGIKKLFASESKKRQERSPYNDLTQIVGVKAIFASQSKRVSTPKNDLGDVRGVKKLFASGKGKSPRNDLRNVAGVKRLLKTPGRKQKSPKNDLTKAPNLKALFSPTKHSSPRNDLTDVRGVRGIFKLPRGSRANATIDLSGIAELINSEHTSLTEVHNSNEENSFDKLIGKTPIKKDYTRVKSLSASKVSPIAFRPNKSLGAAIENVDNWLEQELQKRVSKNDSVSQKLVNSSPASRSVQRESESGTKSSRKSVKSSAQRTKMASRELQRLTTDTVEGTTPVSISRRARMALKDDRSNLFLEVSKILTPARKKTVIPDHIDQRSLPLKKRSLSSDRLSAANSLRIAEPNGEDALNQSGSEFSLPFKKRLLLKTQVALVHSTPVKKRKSDILEGADADSVDLGHVSPIVVSPNVTPRKSAASKDQTQLSPQPVRLSRNRNDVLVSVKTDKKTSAQTKKPGRRSKKTDKITTLISSEDTENPNPGNSSQNITELDIKAVESPTKKSPVKAKRGRRPKSETSHNKSLSLVVLKKTPKLSPAKNTRGTRRNKGSQVQSESKKAAKKTSVALGDTATSELTQNPISPFPKKTRRGSAKSNEETVTGSPVVVSPIKPATKVTRGRNANKNVSKLESQEKHSPKLSPSKGRPTRRNKDSESESKDMKKVNKNQTSQNESIDLNDIESSVKMPKVTRGRKTTAGRRSLVIGKKITNMKPAAITPTKNSPKTTRNKAKDVAPTESSSNADSSPPKVRRGRPPLAKIASLPKASPVNAKTTKGRKKSSTKEASTSVSPKSSSSEDAPPARGRRSKPVDGIVSSPKVTRGRGRKAPVAESTKKQGAKPAAEELPPKKQVSFADLPQKAGPRATRRKADTSVEPAEGKPQAKRVRKTVANSPKKASPKEASPKPKSTRRARSAKADSPEKKTKTTRATRQRK